MEYVYAVMLLNKAGKEITEDNVTAVLKSAGVEVDAAKVKSLIAALEGVDIEQVIAESSQMTAAAPAAGAVPASGEAEAAAGGDAEEKQEESQQSEEDAAAGLGSLF
jgi:large subunit ribosomal protein L12